MMKVSNQSVKELTMENPRQAILQQALYFIGLCTVVNFLLSILNDHDPSIFIIGIYILGSFLASGLKVLMDRSAVEAGEDPFI